MGKHYQRQAGRQASTQTPKKHTRPNAHKWHIAGELHFRFWCRIVAWSSPSPSLRFQRWCLPFVRQPAMLHVECCRRQRWCWVHLSLSQIKLMLMMRIFIIRSHRRRQPLLLRLMWFSFSSETVRSEGRGAGGNLCLANRKWLIIWKNIWMLFSDDKWCTYTSPLERERQ